MDDSTPLATAQETRHYRFEQIRARELARGATEDQAAQIAAQTVDKASGHSSDQ